MGKEYEIYLKICLKLYFSKFDMKYCKQFASSHKELSFLPEKVKGGKYEKLISIFRDENSTHIKNQQQALNHGLKLKKTPKAIKFDQF